MSRREHEPLTDFDPHDALFGDADEHDPDPHPYRPTRAERRRDDHERQNRRRTRRGWLGILITLAIVVAVLVLVVPRVIDYFKVDDYSGDGAGNPTVTISVVAGDSASDIADTLVGADVIKSAKAFTNAADDNPDSQSIQPGAYDLHQQQSGKGALGALLDPASRNAANDVVVTEGATVFDVSTRLAKVLGADQKTAIDDALGKPASLSLPLGYGKPTTAEGFLYPATYTVSPDAKPVEALRSMVTRFVSQDRSSDFAADATKQGISPYEALIVASVVQAEAKFADDMPKVAEVIYNRLKANQALQIDATTKYGCELEGEKDCIYNNFPTPYNSYLNDGLPPTPIDNPGAQALAAAVHPETGKLLFYVNGDAEGHLAFSTNEKDFVRDRNRCAANNWGCA